MVDELLRRNRTWAEQQQALDSDFFSALAKGQSPEFFWVGCSDSRVSAELITRRKPGEVFVHRNVANVVHPTDLSLLSALEFAIEVLGIRKILVCGHDNCGGIRASTEARNHGLADHWLEPVRRLANCHRVELDALEDEEARLDRLAELNVSEGVRRVSQTPILRSAWQRGLPVRIHGLIYHLHDGLLRELEPPVTAPCDA